jgi:O-antigen ligase
VIVVRQGFLAYEFNLTFYAGNFIPWEFYHGGLDNNGIAITMVTSIGMAFFLGLHSKKWWQRLLALALAALMVHVVLFSNSRGGMVSLIVSSVATLLVLPKKPVYYLVFAVGILVGFRLAGPAVQERFATIFEDPEQEDGKVNTKQRRLDHWQACLDSMVRHPLGVGPNHWPVTAPQYNLPAMAGHSTWLQMGAELGFPGLLFLFGFYGLSCKRLWPLSRSETAASDPEISYIARMVLVSLAGFFVAAQFVTVDGVELPYYIALLGAGALKLADQPAQAPEPSTKSADCQEQAPEIACPATLGHPSEPVAF